MIRKLCRILLLSFCIAIALLCGVTWNWLGTLQLWPAVGLNLEQWPERPGETVAYVDRGVLNIVHLGAVSGSACKLAIVDTWGFSWSSMAAWDGGPDRQCRQTFVAIPLVVIGSLLGLYPALYALKIVRRRRVTAAAVGESQDVLS